jgi:hypothetical protein
VYHGWEKRNGYRVLAGRQKGRRPVGRPGRRWEDSIKRNFREIRVVSCVMDWIHLAQDRDKWRTLVITIMNCRIS